MKLYATPIEWRRITPEAAVPVMGADLLSPAAMRAIRRTYRDLRIAGSCDRRSRGRTFPPAKARQIVAHLLGAGWSTGYAHACADGAAIRPVGPGWRLVTDDELAARAHIGSAA